MRFWLAVAMVGTALTLQSFGRDIYVSNLGGNDRADGRALKPIVRGTGPVRTIHRALQLAAAGDRVILENTGTPYRETLSLIGSRHSGGPAGPLVIEGRGAVLDGTVPIRDEQWEHFSADMYSCRPARLGYQQLFLAGRPATRHPVAKHATQPPELAPLEWCFWRGQILFRVEEGRLPEMYQASCCGLQTGITLYYVHDVIIRDLLVQGFGVDGVAVHDVVTDCRLERVISSNNGMSGVSVRGASWFELDDCKLFGNGHSQLRVEDFARCWLYQCELSSETAPAIERSGGEVFRSAEPFTRAAR